MTGLRPAICAVVLACATPSAMQNGRPVLVGIDFAGNDHVSAKDLRDHIATEATSGLFSKTVRYYDEDLFELDKERIVRFYQSRGFYEAEVQKVDAQTDKEGRVTLLVHIKEGPGARVSNVRIDGLEKLTQKERDRVARQLGLGYGDELDEDTYEKGKQKVLVALRERGYAEAKVDGKVEVFPEEGRAQITLKADLGPQYHFGRVLVSGNRRIPADLIARATGIERGDLYKPSALELAQQRVYNLGAFSGVRVGLEPLPGQPIAPVRVTVREAPFQTVRFGIGAQVETERYELPRLRAEYTNRNLFGGLRRLELISTAGYALTPTPIDPTKTGVVTTTSAVLTTPNVFIPSLDFIARGEYAREIQVSFDYQRVAARFSFLYRSGKHSIAPALNLVRYYDVNVPAESRENGLVAPGGVVNASAQPSLLTDSCSTACTLTYPELRYTYDARDSVLEPTRGFYGTIDLQQTLKPGSFTYFKFEPELRAYLTLARTVTLAGRIDYGAILLPAGGNSPATERFFAGGANSNRGYGANRQGPKYGATPTGYFPTTDSRQNFGGYYTAAVPAGGNGLLLVSGEARVHTDFILDHLMVVGFVDASRVTSTWQLPWESALEVAPGLGLRYITPFGPIRFDVGYLVNPAIQVAFNHTGSVLGTIVTQPTVVSASCNSASCIRESRWSYHLTLGEAF